MPIIRSSTTAVAAFGLPLERGGSSVVGRGPDRPRPTTLLPPRSSSKPCMPLIITEICYRCVNTLRAGDADLRF